MESGQLLPPYELMEEAIALIPFWIFLFLLFHFFAFRQYSVSSNLVVFSENARDKIREKNNCFIFFSSMRKRKKEGKELPKQCEIIHNFSFSQMDIISFLVALFMLFHIPFLAQQNTFFFFFFIFLFLLKQNPSPSSFRGEFHSWMSFVIIIFISDWAI